MDPEKAALAKKPEDKLLQADPDKTLPLEGCISLYDFEVLLSPRFCRLILTGFDLRKSAGRHYRKERGRTIRQRPKTHYVCFSASSSSYNVWELTCKSEYSQRNESASIPPSSLSAESHGQR
jgi:hypothetical protein